LAPGQRRLELQGVAVFLVMLFEKKECVEKPKIGPADQSEFLAA
jgi:hypothetical protein